MNQTAGFERGYLVPEQTRDWSLLVPLLCQKDWRPSAPHKGGMLGSTPSFGTICESSLEVKAPALGAGFKYSTISWFESSLSLQRPQACNVGSHKPPRTFSISRAVLAKKTHDISGEPTCGVPLNKWLIGRPKVPVINRCGVD